VFDAENEAAFALEGRVLDAARRATTPAARRARAQEFVGVRRARHARVPNDVAEFDRMSELNEGLAEYALARALELVARDEGAPAAWRAAARRRLAERAPLLADLTASEQLSLRFRFYQTGPAIAALLDDLAGPSWKARLVADDQTLEDALAVASGVDSVAIAARARAERTFDAAGARALSARRVERLKASRAAKADSVLAGPGVRLVLAADSLPGRAFNSCGYDPQNILPVTPLRRVHTRWWRPCAGGPTMAEFNVPSVQDDSAGTVSAVIGPLADVRLSAGGQPVTLRDGETLRDLRAFKLEAPRVSVEAARADVARVGDVLTIWPKRP
jgi:hypothetical protein